MSFQYAIDLVMDLATQFSNILVRYVDKSLKVEIVANAQSSSPAGRHKDRKRRRLMEDAQYGKVALDNISNAMSILNELNPGQINKGYEFFLEKNRKV